MSGVVIVSKKGGSGDQNNIPRVQRIVFDDTISGTREMQILKAINEAQPWDQSFAIAENEFYLIRAMSLNQPQYVGYVAPVFRYHVKNVGKNEEGGKYGYGGVPLTLDNLEFISATGASVSDFENLESTDKIFIEDLEGMTIADYVTQNAPIVIKDKSEGETIFLTGIAPDYISYWFVGESGTYGQGSAEATDLDFQSLSAVVDPLTVETVAEMIAEAALLKQDKLVAGVNIKNFNSISILGAGNISIPVFPPPYLEELIPDSYRPNNTGDFILKGSYFTEGMTGIFEGQTLNGAINVISSNLAKANLTTGNAEGMFDVTLNNGTSRTFPDALFIVEGNVFKPTHADWTVINGSPDFSEDGKFKLTSFGENTTAKWNKLFDHTKDFRVAMNLLETPLGNYKTRDNEHIFFQICRVSDNAVLFSIFYQNQSYADRVYFQGGSLSENGLNYGLVSYTDLMKTDKNPRFAFEWNNGVMRLFRNEVILRTFAQSVLEDTYLKINTSIIDFQDIKYIELL